MTDNRSILRLLILLVAVTSGMTLYAGPRFDQTLPQQLLTFIHARAADAELSTPEAIAAAAIGLQLIGMVVGLVGMWWCRRWARWIFTVAMLSSPVLTTLLGLSDPRSLVSNAIEAGANSASDLAVGATLALIWFSMERDFTTSPGRESNVA
jgi:hypothetical protein